jgi:NAD(P)-dependent dehydrogenase (short-subunit alcohol dehydrogenase family)
MNVEDKVAVVTGGAQGIGLALCTRFAREGAHVVLSDLSERARPAGRVRSARPAEVDV